MTAEAVSVPAARARPKFRLPNWAYPTLALIAIVILWDVSIRVFDVKAFILPTPLSVAQSLVDDWNQLGPGMLYTLYEILAGFGIAVVVGIAIAIAIVSSHVVEKTLYPILVGSQVIPKVALAPLFVMWFGFGITPKILVAFLIAFFPMVISTAIGLRSVEIPKLYLARSMGATTLQIFFKIRLPHALPSIFAGLKLAITAAVIGAIVGEFIGADQGIGRILQIANGNLQTDTLFAGIFLLSMTGVILFLIVEGLERVAIRWHVSQRVKYDVTL